MTRPPQKTISAIVELDNNSRQARLDVIVPAGTRLNVGKYLKDKRTGKFYLVKSFDSGEIVLTREDKAPPAEEILEVAFSPITESADEANTKGEANDKSRCISD
ncbi:MAG: hypothetical protein V1809_10380 [Planctomycetota bacterium]